MLKGVITVQSTGAKMAVGRFSWVKLLPLVYHPPPPTSLASGFRIISPLGRGTPRQLEEAIFFFNSWKHSSSLVVHLQGVVFLIRSVRGAGE